MDTHLPPEPGTPLPPLMLPGHSAATRPSVWTAPMRPPASSPGAPTACARNPASGLAALPRPVRQPAHPGPAGCGRAGRPARRGEGRSRDRGRRAPQRDPRLHPGEPRRAALAALHDMLAPTARVRRNGEVEVVDAATWSPAICSCWKPANGSRPTRGCSMPTPPKWPRRPSPENPPPSPRPHAVAADAPWPSAGHDLHEHRGHPGPPGSGGHRHRHGHRDGPPGQPAGDTAEPPRPCRSSSTPWASAWR
jgi:hypothetical protein